MNEKEFAEILASAIIMVLRAFNRRYGLRIWVLTRGERRELERKIRECENGQIYVSEIVKFFNVDN